MSATSTLRSAPAATAGIATEPGHVHRWRIDEQAGPDSAGTCLCGTLRRFQNGWAGDSTLVLGGGNWVEASRRGRAATQK